MLPHNLPGPVESLGRAQHSPHCVVALLGYLLHIHFVLRWRGELLSGVLNPRESSESSALPIDPTFCAARMRFACRASGNGARAETLAGASAMFLPLAHRLAGYATMSDRYKVMQICVNLHDGKVACSGPSVAIGCAPANCHLGTSRKMRLPKPRACDHASPAQGPAAVRRERAGQIQSRIKSKIFNYDFGMTTLPPNGLDEFTRVTMAVLFNA